MPAAILEQHKSLVQIRILFGLSTAMVSRVSNDARCTPTLLGTDWQCSFGFLFFGELE